MPAQPPPLLPQFANNRPRKEEDVTKVTHQYNRLKSRSISTTEKKKRPAVFPFCIVVVVAVFVVVVVVVA
jgi:t-SNARE complex subunit (syntaxin)